jgi:hypothetical protein
MGITWPPVIARAKAICESFPSPITLRRLFYLLVSEGVIPNEKGKYQTLSKRTVGPRRSGSFPSLVDLTSQLYKAPSWTSPGSLLAAAADQYRRDRTEGQKHNVFIGVEKNGLRPTLESWFDEYGVHVFAGGGYNSASFEINDVNRAIRRDGRPAVLLYGGDLDPSGVHIYKDFLKHTGPWAHKERVAITIQQTEDNNIPLSAFEKADPRNPMFLNEYGDVFQVEIDALDALAPGKMKEFYMDAFMRYWDKSAFDKVIEREDEERKRLAEFVDSFDEGGVGG